ncbi:MAG: hypothetical protein AMXMBFR59_24390 [Rhodanobacteraceae bacterium]
MSSAPTPVPASRSAAPVARPGRPVVVALIGLPGAGKSLVARALADQLGYRRIDRDAIRHAMFPRCSYSFVEKRASFRGVLLALEVNCMLGESSVIDGCTFSRRADLARVDQVVKQHAYTPIPIFLDCPSELARERIARDVTENRHLARDRNPDVVGEVLARMEPPPPGALSIDARLPAAEVCRLAVEAVADIAGIPR